MMLEIVDDIGDVINVVNDVRTYVLNAVVLLLMIVLSVGPQEE